MGDRLWHYIAACVDNTDADLSYPQRICLAGTELLDVDSMSIALVVDGHYEPLGSADELGSRLDELQFSLGDGPTFSAKSGDDALLIEDLSHPSARNRWPLFCDAVRSYGLAGVFSFPLRIGAANLGVMTGYRTSVADLSALQFSHGLVLSSFAATEIVRSLAGDPDRITDARDPIIYDQSMVQFAAGMVAESLDVSIVDSLVRIRAHAFSAEMTVTEVARLIVSGRLVMDL